MRRAFLLLVVTACSKPPLVVPVDSGLCGPTRSLPVGSAGFLPYGHAHNDYQHTRPLLDALDQRFYSVEADVWLRSGTIVVSHDALTSKGALKDLYLDPLQARVTRDGSVYGDGVQFVLWIDLKQSSPELRAALEALLEQYPMLTVFTDDTVKPGPVTAVLTGNDTSKRAYVTERATRHAIRDRGSYSMSNPRADNTWAWYGLDWYKYMTWDGTMTIPDADRTRLGCLVGDIHANGAKVRFWNNPETSAYRTVCIETGVDLIGTDELQKLHDFLAGVTP